MDRNNSNDRTIAGVIAATAIIATIALLALAGLTGSICAAGDENSGGSEGEIAGAAVSAASVTDIINYQGRLTDSIGSPLTGTYAMTFGLYDVSTGGTALATDTHDVDVADGLFNTGIDFGTSDFDGRELWLGVTVGTDAEMTPRQEFRPVPYALSLVPGARIIGSNFWGPVLTVENAADHGTGVYACSKKYNGIAAKTDRSDHDYAFYTHDDNIYVGGKIDVVGAVDPITTECFDADPAVDYVLGDVVTLDEGSPYVKPCTEADDTKVVGVVGPTLDIEDGEISVVIMGYRGARPDEEHVKVLEMRISDAEASMAEPDLRMGGAEAESVAERKGMENEVAMLRIEIEEAKSVTRQVVKVKVDASHAPIKRGDLLTTSPTAGHAMKAQPVDLGGVEIHRPGTLIGKAMEPLDSGTGLIEVFVTLQ